VKKFALLEPKLQGRGAEDMFKEGDEPTVLRRLNNLLQW